MNKVFLTYNSIISALGFTTQAVVNHIKNEVSGISLTTDNSLFQKPFFTSMVDRNLLNENFDKLNPKERYTSLEKMLILSLQDVISNCNLPIDNTVGLIISTTKGNIDALNEKNPFPESYAYLSRLSHALKSHFKFKTEPIVVSNACVSGVLVISVAKKLIDENVYKNVLIASGDLVSAFVLSGFNSFQALSDEPCKPYSIDRKGINLGEAASSILVTSDSRYLNRESVQILGDASCNDANHISGPSRTGEGLFRSVENAMKEAKIQTKDIDYISAHGTATFYNDEMEAIAFNRLGLENVPLNSLKGYFGHTLGSSGLVETIVGMHALEQNTLFASKGFTELGVPKPLNIIKNTEYNELNIFLKTASGFGGANTALVLKKYHKN